ncbi:hypothetical protein CANARDRAFT_9877 [[Candida] arabinofermentans NRRL YB-2248]|uniref:Zn(2)-C6 fungal-type domain-containing protein n=1 Tax=[Candida] arabinofermentans NRRL YB-2248 TaxID=983967 RepID=A0A1E4SUG8_9ASCO|nr:hypothetical protein CANARDRAFT_9877 [[Candida] arabinofermentans NRRL YB-2248]
MSDTESKKRKRSSKACVICHQRKIKCDLDFKEPNEKCSNCSELGLSCDLYQRKKRIKKYQIQENLNCLLQRTKIEKLSAIQLDPTCFTFGYAKNDFQSPAGDLQEKIIFNCIRDYEIQSHSLDSNYQSLNINGCFNLPERSICETYIDCYFAKVHPIMPLLDKEKFLLENTGENLTTPKSLLLLQTVLFTGCKNLYDEDCENLSNILYKRSKYLYDNNFEKNPVHLLQTLIIFELCRCDFYYNLTNGMNWLQISTNVLESNGFSSIAADDSTSPEKDSIVKIVWLVALRDRLESLFLNRPFICNIPQTEQFSKNVEQALLKESVDVQSYGVFLFKFFELSNKIKSSNDLKVKDFLLYNWLQSIDIDLNSRFGLFLINMYLGVLISIHKQNLTISKDSSYHPSWGIVLQASILLTKLVQDINVDNFILTNFTFVVLFTASNSLMFYQFVKAPKYKKIVYNMIDSILNVYKRDTSQTGSNQKLRYVLTSLWDNKVTQAELLKNILERSKEKQPKIIENNEFNSDINFQEFKASNLLRSLIIDSKDFTFESNITFSEQPFPSAPDSSYVDESNQSSPLDMRLLPLYEKSDQKLTSMSDSSSTLSSPKLSPSRSEAMFSRFQQMNGKDTPYNRGFIDGSNSTSSQATVINYAGNVSYDNNTRATIMDSNSSFTYRSTVVNTTTIYTNPSFNNRNNGNNGNNGKISIKSLISDFDENEPACFEDVEENEDLWEKIDNNWIPELELGVDDSKASTTMKPMEL